MRPADVMCAPRVKKRNASQHCDRRERIPVPPAQHHLRRRRRHHLTVERRQGRTYLLQKRSLILKINGSPQDAGPFPGIKQHREKDTDENAAAPDGTAATRLTEPFLRRFTSCRRDGRRSRESCGRRRRACRGRSHRAACRSICMVLR